MAKLKKAVAAVEAAAETVWIKVLSPILHDGEKLAIGAVHEIESGCAEALVALGAAEPASAPDSQTDSGSDDAGNDPV